MKLPHFLLFCACASLAGVALAQGSPRGPSGDRGRNLEREFAPGLGLGRDRPDERERESQREPRYQMSPEERRQLRRDVNDAGRELYGRPGRADRPDPLQP